MTLPVDKLKQALLLRVGETSSRDPDQQDLTCLDGHEFRAWCARKLSELIKKRLESRTEEDEWKALNPKRWKDNPFARVRRMLDK